MCQILFNTQTKGTVPRCRTLLRAGNLGAEISLIEVYYKILKIVKNLHSFFTLESKRHMYFVCALNLGAEFGSIGTYLAPNMVLRRI